MNQQDHELDHRLTHRMIFFTDAVFAIVMTLLVLELRPPEGADAASLVAIFRLMGGKFFAFALSFVILSIFWVAHLSTTRRLLHFDWLVTVANLVFLLPICLIPFVSAWVGGAINSGPSWAAYCVVLIATSLANMVLVLVQSRGRGRLIAGGVTRRQLVYRLSRSLAPGVAFTAGLGFVLADQVRLAQFCSVIIPPYLALCRAFLQPPEDRGPARAKPAKRAA